MTEELQKPMEGAASAVEPNAGPSKLPRRDWILLPLISLLTIVSIVVSTELIAHLVIYRPPATNGKCLQFKDPSAGMGAVPNSVCRSLTEGQWVEYRFNSSGFRAGMEGGQKQPGTYRIVMTGSSTAMGLNVPREDSFAALLPVQLSQLTGRKVELYNEALMTAHPESIARWFNEVLDAKPDLILWIITPFDIQVGPYHPEPEPDPRAGPVTKALFLIKNRPATESLPDALREVWTNYSRTAVLVRRLMYLSHSQFLKSYLMGDDVSGFLKTEPTPLWQSRMEYFDSYAASIGAQAKAAGVPFAAVLLPVSAQADMISMGEWPAGYDPYRLNNELRAVVTRNGGVYIDVLPAFREMPDPDQVFLSADEHPSVTGHAVFSDLLAKGLTSGAVPAIEVPTQQRILPVQERKR